MAPQPQTLVEALYRLPEGEERGFRFLGLDRKERYYPYAAMRAEAEGAMVVGSTDMGNVSYSVPAIHPMIKVAPEGTLIHTPEFEVYAGREEGDAAQMPTIRGENAQRGGEHS